MVVLKDSRLSINLEPILFQIVKENVDAWYNSQGIILKTKLLQFLKKGKLK